MLIVVEDDDEEEEASSADDQDDDRFAVWPENWESVLLFHACATQWNVLAIPVGMEVGHLRYLGLRYEGCAAMMADLKIQNRTRAWSDLRIMEAEAKGVMNEHVNKKP